MTIRVTKRQTYHVSDGHSEFEICHRPLDDAAVSMAYCPNGAVVVGYVINDFDAECPTGPVSKYIDVYGSIYEFTRHAKPHYLKEGFAALGLDADGRPDPNAVPDPYAVILSKYEHSQVQWYVAGSDGPACRWDTVKRAGVWVPSPRQREQIMAAGAADSAVHKEGERRRAREMAHAACAVYTAYCNGESCGYVIEVFGDTAEYESPAVYAMEYYDVEEAHKVMWQDVAKYQKAITARTSAEKSKN